MTRRRGEISVKGPLGTLKQAGAPQCSGEAGRQTTVVVEPTDESMQADAMSGTLRALFANMVQGVSKGFRDASSIWSAWAIARKRRATS